MKIMILAAIFQLIHQPQHFTKLALIIFLKAPIHHRVILFTFKGILLCGIYARSFLEGRLTRDQLGNFRQEISGKGLSSYPHPWLMQDYWQFPTVSMGLGPIFGIYQAHIMRFLEKKAF